VLSPYIHIFYLCAYNDGKTTGRCPIRRRKSSKPNEESKKKTKCKGNTKRTISKKSRVFRYVYRVISERTAISEGNSFLPTSTKYLSFIRYSDIDHPFYSHWLTMKCQANLLVIVRYAESAFRLLRNFNKDPIAWKCLETSCIPERLVRDVTELDLSRRSDISRYLFILSFSVPVSRFVIAGDPQNDSQNNRWAFCPSGSGLVPRLTINDTEWDIMKGHKVFRGYPCFTRDGNYTRKQRKHREEFRHCRCAEPIGQTGDRPNFSMSSVEDDDVLRRRVIFKRSRGSSRGGWALLSRERVAWPPMPWCWCWCTV